MDDAGKSSEGCIRPEPGGLHSSVLVLNRMYMPVQVIGARRAFSLLYKDSAEIITQEQDRICSYDFSRWVELSMDGYAARYGLDDFIRTPQLRILVPRVIRLRRYDRFPTRAVKFNRRNILARDDHRCQYCGKRLPPSLLSIDHVVPRSRGGKSCWSNVVAACNACNTRKGGRLPHEAGMHLLHPPAAPKRNPLLAEKVSHQRYHIWRLFIQDAGGVDPW